jgi:ribosomal protein S18 acetylase RimI-like enzyme
MARFAEYRPAERGGPPPEGLALRPATPADIDALAALRAARDEVSVADARESFTRLLTRADASVLVATAGGRVLGYGVTVWFDPPRGAPRHCAPAGWYLGGLVVAEGARRRGVGAALTEARLAWIAARAPRAYYFANEQNGATIDLHARFGFRELTRSFWHPGASFVGGVGILFAADLAAGAPGPGSPPRLP